MGNQNAWYCPLCARREPFLVVDRGEARGSWLKVEGSVLRAVISMVKTYTGTLMPSFGFFRLGLDLFDELCLGLFEGFCFDKDAALEAIEHVPPIC